MFSAKHVHLFAKTCTSFSKNMYIFWQKAGLFFRNKSSFGETRVLSMESSIFLPKNHFFAQIFLCVKIMR